MYEKFKYTSVAQDVDKTLEKIANKLEVKLNESISILNHTMGRIESYNDKHTLSSAIYPCDDNDLALEISSVKQILRKHVQKSKILKKAIKHQYFLSMKDLEQKGDTEIGQCKEVDHSMIWSNYVGQMQDKKNIVLLIDHGGSLSRQQFKIVKELCT